MDTTIIEQADLAGRHIGYWDSRAAAWRPWCEVYGEEWMPENRPTPPSNEVCPACFVLAVGELRAEEPRLQAQEERRDPH